MGVIQMLRRDLHQSRVSKKYAAVERAIKAKARVASDFEYNSTMRKFYDERVDEIDPHSDWWAFAEAKQKQHDHRNAEDHYAQRLRECVAKVESNKKAFLAAQKEMSNA